MDTFLQLSGSRVISLDVDSITSLGSLFQSLTTLSVVILPEAQAEAPQHSLIPHCAAVDGCVHLAMEESPEVVQWLFQAEEPSEDKGTTDMGQVAG